MSVSEGSFVTHWYKCIFEGVHMFRNVSINPEREKQACEDYKFAFSAKSEEFLYLYKRTDHYITFNWLLTAFYVPAFVLALTASTSAPARQFIFLYLIAISTVGILAPVLPHVIMLPVAS